MTQPTDTNTSAADEPWDITPTQAQAAWVEATTQINAMVRYAPASEIKAWIDELDENLTAWNEGEVPPGSDEMHGVYFDAIAREAIPYGSSPISADQVAEELDGTLRVARLDVPALRAETSIHGPTEAMLERALGASQTSEQPAADTSRARVANAIRGLGAGEAPLASDAADTRPADGAAVTIYTTPNCPGCFATKRALDKAEIDYETIDLSERPDLVEAFRAQGLRQAPIVEADGDRWSGFNPAKLREHGLDHRTRQRRDDTTKRPDSPER